jgi:branched-chain amino acid transport system ATP-binding protein
MSEFALEADRLCKSYGALLVSDNVSLRLRKGARHALIGPNGAGKTTLVGLLSGVIRPDSGHVHIIGKDMTRDSAAKRTRRGLIRSFQVTNLFPDMTVVENLYLAVSHQRRIGLDLFRPAGKRTDVLMRVEQIIDKVRLRDKASHKLSELAYGQQRLVELAIALALEPRILLLDEPAAGIPSSDIGLLLTVIEDLDPDITILMIEHDMQLVRRFATEATVLVRGKVLISGSLSDVMSSEDVHRVYLGRPKPASGSDKEPAYA